METRSRTYENLSTMLQSGVPLSEAARVAAGDGTGTLAHSLHDLGQRVLEQGGDEEMLASVTPPLPEIDQALLSCGIASGRLPEVTRDLAQWYDLEEKNRAKLVTGLAYPVFLIHFAILALSVVVLLTEGPIAFAFSVLQKLAVIYVPALIILFLWKRGSPTLRALWDRLPYYGRATRLLALSRYCRVFHALLSSGASVLDGGAIALRASNHPTLREDLQMGLDAAHAGRPLGDGFGPGLPAEFRSSWTVAEQSGQLEETALRLAERYSEEGQRALETGAALYTKVFLVVTVASLGVVIVLRFLGMYSSLNQ